MGAGVVWIVNYFTQREAKVVDPLISSVNELAGAVKDVTAKVDILAKNQAETLKLEEARQAVMRYKETHQLKQIRPDS